MNSCGLFVFKEFNWLWYSPKSTLLVVKSEQVNIKDISLVMDIVYLKPLPNYKLVFCT